MAGSVVYISSLLTGSIFKQKKIKIKGLEKKTFSTTAAGLMKCDKDVKLSFSCY